MIVVDVGCGRYGGDYSLEHLIDDYTPDQLYGFDPNPIAVRDAAWWLPEREPDEVIGMEYQYGPHPYVELKAWAAWVTDGQLSYFADGLASWTSDAHPKLPRVPCFDLAAFIADLDETEDVILKLDCEGAEFYLVEHLIAQGTVDRLKLLIIEWHDARAVLERQLKGRTELVAWGW